MNENHVLSPNRPVADISRRRIGDRRDVSPVAEMSHRRSGYCREGLNYSYDMVYAYPLLL